MFEFDELGRRISNDVYRRQAPRLRTALLKAQHQVLEQVRFPVVVFGSADGAGEYESVNPLNEWMDPRHCQTHAFGPPAAEDRGHPRMARCWRTLPPKRRIGLYFDSRSTDPMADRVFKRSSREQFECAVEHVLVARVEGYRSDTDWMRACGEINNFALEMSDAGTIVVKFWLAISGEERVRRFMARENVGYKRYKITADDWRNRKKWDRYQQAADDMFDRTSTAHAPWTVVEANDKHFARLKVLDTLCERIEATL